MTAAEAFGQYLELWRAGRPDGAPRLLADAAANAAAAIPDAIAAYKRDKQDLEQCQPDVLFAPDYGVNINGLRMTADVAASFHCGVPQLNSLLCVVANDTVHLPIADRIPSGLEIYSLRDIPDRYAADVAALMATDSRPQSLLNTLLLSDGIYVRVAEGAVIDKPLQIVNIFNSNMPMLTARRIIVDARTDSSIKILLCDHSQTPATAHLSSQIVRVHLAAGAAVELYDIEESSAATKRCWQLHTTQDDCSELSVCTAFLSGGCTRNDYLVEVAGNDAVTNLSGLAICSDRQIADNRVVLRHSGLRCRSRQLFKNAMFGESAGAFGGRIVVEEGAEFTDAVQSNRNILASASARMLTAPQLEIYCDEVKCGHGATTGQLDERALFYMQSRGIPRREAEMLLTQAFMNDVVENISFEVLRQRLHVLVEKRLNGTSGSCDTCAASCRAIKEETR